MIGAISSTDLIIAVAISVHERGVYRTFACESLTPCIRRGLVDVHGIVHPFQLHSADFPLSTSCPIPLPAILRSQLTARSPPFKSNAIKRANIQAVYICSYPPICGPWFSYSNGACLQPSTRLDSTLLSLTERGAWILCLRTTTFLLKANVIPIARRLMQGRLMVFLLS